MYKIYLFIFVECCRCLCHSIREYPIQMASGLCFVLRNQKKMFFFIYLNRRNENSIIMGGKKEEEGEEKASHKKGHEVAK